MNILFVCTGNTCRSPMAEGFANHIATNENLNIIATSAGLDILKGSTVSKNSVISMMDYNIDISMHIPRQLTNQMLVNSDIIITMTDFHKKYLLNYFPTLSSNIYTLSELGGVGDITDPYGYNLDIYKQCAKEIYDGIKGFIRKYNDEH